MANPDWGTKRTCQSCSARFYDLKRDPILCPKCEAVFDPLANLRPRRSRAAAAPVADKKAKVPVPAKIKVDAVDEEDIDDETADTDDDLADIEDDDEEDPIEDASELADDDDVAEVVVKADDDDR